MLVFTLWVFAIYLVKEEKVLVTLIRSLFMASVCRTYIFIAPKRMALTYGVSYIMGGIYTIVGVMLFASWYKKQYSKNEKIQEI